MRHNVLKIIAIISVAVAVVTVIFTTIEYFRLKPYSGTYSPIVENAQEYVDAVTATDYDSEAALEGLRKLRDFYPYYSVMYEMYLADYRNEPLASYFFWDSITSFYRDLELEVPPLTLNFALALLMKGADQLDKEAFRDCCTTLVEVYSNGKYVPRDMILVNFYQERLSAAE